MKLFGRHQIMAIAAAALVASALGGAARANNIYVFSMDTAPFVGNSAGPFYLDFQLAQGDGGVDNSVTVSDFNFDATHGGAAGAVYTQSSSTPFVGFPSVEPFGGVSGSAATTIGLTDDPSVNPAAAPFNELIQAFTPGDSLSFVVTATSGLVNATEFTPDEFSFGILEKNGTQVSTTAPNESSLLTETFNSSQTIAVYSPILPASVPLPSPAALIVLCLPLVAWLSRRIISSPR